MASSSSRRVLGSCDGTPRPPKQGRRSAEASLVADTGRGWGCRARARRLGRAHPRPCTSRAGAAPAGRRRAAVGEEEADHFFKVGLFYSHCIVTVTQTLL